MKRFLAGLLAVAASFSLLTGCGQQGNAVDEQEPQSAVEPGYEEGLTTRVAALKGPTAMGLVCLMDENEGEDAHYSFDLYTSGDEIVPLIGKGEVDIALIPTNLAATLYQKTEGGVQVLDVNAGNVLYVVSHDEAIIDLNGLKGKTVYMTGKGTSPDWTLQYLLDKADMSESDLTIEFKTEATEVVSALAQDASAVGILPQPFATVAMLQDQELSMNFPLESVWERIQPGRQRHCDRCHRGAHGVCQGASGSGSAVCAGSSGIGHSGGGKSRGGRGADRGIWHCQGGGRAAGD